MLQDFGVGQNDDERRELVESLGFHAQSLALLRQVQGGPNAGMPRQGGVQAARDWLLRRVLDELPEREKRAIARLSIFDYPARLDLVEVVLDELGPDSLRALQRRDLLRIDMGCVTIHDAVRGVGLELISRSTVEACHRAVANRLFSELVHDHEREGSVLYEKGIHWAVHLESSGDVSDLGGRFSLILNSDATFLRALFGVSYLGFPYEFEDPSLDHAVELIEELEEKALIEEDPANDGKPFMEGPALLLRDFNYFEDILIRALCFHHGYAGQVGYMAEMRPNFAFRQQGLLCPWEHCIELSPLPMSSRAEWEESLEEDRRRLADPAAHNLSNKHIEVIQARLEEGVPEWVPEEVDYELRARSCPVFGHACPGGQAQAETCRTRGHFEWATDPRN
jgi:hypothetical protein